MDVLGALKKSGSDNTIYFCAYHQIDFDWDDVVILLLECNHMRDLDEKDICCIAVESSDGLKTQRYVGISFFEGTNYVILTKNSTTEDVDFYLKEMEEDLVALKGSI